MVAPTTSFDTQHGDMIHDAQMDYYGKRLATASSDRTVRIFEVDAEGNQKPRDVLKGHDGPVWQVSWAHPKFGAILASGGYDGRICVWKEGNGGDWSKIKEHSLGTSVNSVAWAPHELGPVLACASADGNLTILTFKDDGKWDTDTYAAHSIGCNAVSWSSAITPGALITASGSGSKTVGELRRLATAGCDNTIKIWDWSEESKSYSTTATLRAHKDWVRDVAFAPNIGLPRSYLASCSQDKTVLIWTQDEGIEGPWISKPLTSEGFPDVVWRVSWSLTGHILAVSTGDNRVTLWKENIKSGVWECVSEMDEKSSYASSSSSS
ncbi:MAG: WD40-repeat-containing domain protein [Piptocephalis tieghemiana]|nr:MAG: WD40-repeat-containing domain protein [Piptocephalis tieghemiana]